MFPEISIKRFLAQPEVTWALKRMLMVFGKDTFGAFWQVTRTIVSSVNRQKLMTKTDPPPKGTLDTPPIYTETLSVVFPGTPVGIKDPNSLVLLRQTNKMMLKQTAKVDQAYFLTKFDMQKLAHSRYWHQNSLLYTLFNLISNSSALHHLEAC